MSRIGKKPISLPKGVEVKISGAKVTVKGPKGELVREIHPTIAVSQEGEEIVCSVKDNGKQSAYANFHGLTRSLVNNMVLGVSAGFTKRLKLVGVGYRAAVQGNDLNLTLGYSHPILYPIEQGLKISVDKQTTVIVEGIDKEQVGQTAANIRSFRKPEPYHGKGVRYEDEVIVTKAGKTGSK